MSRYKDAIEMGVLHDCVPGNEAMATWMNWGSH